MYDSNLYTGKERKIFQKMRVAVLSPMIYIEPDYVQSLADAVCYSWNFGLRVEKYAKTWRTVIQWARDDLARTAIDKKSPFSDLPFTHFMWIDADQVFKPDLICQLARHDVDIASALYYHRRGAPKPVAFIRNEQDPTGLKHFTLTEIPPALVEVDAVGFGSMLIKREVFEKMGDPWFTKPWECGEDIAFCIGAKKAGFKIYLDGQYTVGHVGEAPVIGPSTYRDWWEQNKSLTEAYRIPIELKTRGGKDDE